MSEYVIKDETLTAIADAIRTKREKTGQIPTTSMAAEILAIETGSDPDPVEQATPSISVSSAGLITASATQEAGYVSAGTKSATKQLTTQAAQTIIPDTSDKTIASGRYLTGTQTIKGDPNLIPENIKSGVSIFGVTGTHADGVTVQRKRDLFSTDENGMVTETCGFKPDCVIIETGKWDGNDTHSGVMFTDSGENVLSLIVRPPKLNSEHAFVTLTVTQLSDGFSLVAEKVAWDSTRSAHVNWMPYYVALKYT